jgi:outer membrane protein TolC
MKKGLFVIIGLVSCLFVHAQRREASLYIPLIDSPEVAQLKIVLVELAMQNPALKVYEHKLKAAKYETNKAKAQWLNMLQAAGNMNEYTIKNNSNNATFFPRYNFSLTIPLGSFVSIPADVKIARTEKKALINMKEEEQLKLKADVLNAYELYATNKKLMELSVPLLEDVYNNYKQTEEKFSAGDKDVSVETLNIAYRSYNEEMVRRVMLERDIRQAKNELERLIGISLEEAVLQSQARTFNK